MLLQRLYQKRSDQLPSLHLRASQWYENEGFIRQAIEPSLKAGDYSRTALLAELAWREMHMSSQGIEWLAEILIAQGQLNEAKRTFQQLSVGDLEGAAMIISKADRLYCRLPNPDVRPLAAPMARA